MLWITLDNLKRFWKSIRTNPVTFTGEIDLQNTTRYKGHEIATKDDIAANDNKITVDSALSSTSTNPVQNKVINAKINSIIDNQLTGNNVLWYHLHRFGVNPTLPTTNEELNKLGVFFSYFFTENCFPNQPTQYGQLINIPAIKDEIESTQLWVAQPSGKIWHRGGNGNNNVSDTPFTRFLDTDDARKIRAYVIDSISKNVSQLTNDLDYVSYTDGKSLEAGNYLDMHEHDNMNADYTFRIFADGSLTLGNGAYIKVLDSGHLSINGNELWIQ